MRKFIILVSSCVALLLVGYTSYRGFQVWKQRHGIAMAKAYFAKGNARGAFLSLQSVLRANPRNIEACRMMAAMLEMDHLPSSLMWRQLVVELDPQSLDDRFILAQTALAQRNYALATNALAGTPQAAKQTAAYHNIAGTAALLGGNPAEAEAHFSEAVRLDPNDPLPQMDLAVVRLHQTNALDMAEARIALQRVILSSTNASLQNQARRELIVDAMRFKDVPTALNLSQDLAQSANASFSDKLLRLAVLKKTQNAEFRPVLAACEKEAASDPATIAELGQWQSVNLSSAEALDWIRHLPMPMQTNLLVEMLAAKCQFQMGDWTGLKSALDKQIWTDPAHPGADVEFMRHAFIARCLRSQNLAEASSAEWLVAVKAASSSHSSLMQRYGMGQLYELSAAWNWQTEKEQVLWTVVNQFPEERWAFPILRHDLIVGHRTHSLAQLLSIMYKRNPDNLVIENDLASIAMLVGDQGLRPYELARHVFEKEPKNPYYASTYAFSLYLQGKNGEALKVMQTIAPADLKEPSIAAYYGLMLKANGDKLEARKYLDQTGKSQFLPEEEALFAQARAGL
jgi:Flp pilus assembly protein TadD